MLRRRLVAASATSILALGLLSIPSAAGAVSTPSAISDLTAVPGASAGEVLFRWKSSGAHTDYFLLETGLTSFSKSSSLPLRSTGRNAKTFKISSSARSWTMTASQAASAGAPLGSANFLYYRLYAVDKNGSASKIRAYPHLQTVMPKALPTQQAKKGTDLRVATFNVRTVAATTDKRSWLQRVNDVASEILDSGAGVVLLQEVSPGRADGKSGSVGGAPRQTTSLVDKLAAQSGKSHDFEMARTTSYVETGKPHGTQGGRVLYDNKRYKLISDCPETTGKAGYNTSCSFALPILSSDGESARRRGGYALLQDRETGQKFWAVSAHLDQRRASGKSGAAYDKLRGAQGKYLATFVDKINTQNYPVVFGADLNTWQRDPAGYSGHDALISGGFYDTKAATVRVNAEYGTSNKFQTTLAKTASGFGAQIDVVMVKGGEGGADRWVNMMKNPDPDRPSDHNLVYADIRI